MTFSPPLATTTTRPIAPVRPSRSHLQPLGVDQVAVSDGFWGARQSLNAEAIVPHALEWMERLGWLANFDDAASGKRYEHRGREFSDSEVYKIVEAMSWDMARPGGGDHSTRLDEVISRIEGAQDPDGYLHTRYGRAWQQPRYSDFQWGHELYCFGHLIQAAVAHHRATTSTRLLHVATRLAEHVCTMFGKQGLNRVCGHPVIETALVELGRATDTERYTLQAETFVARRGRGTLELHEFGRGYWQDATPVRESTVLHGHAVRALYLAAGATDVAVDRGDHELIEALRRQWDTTVARRTYITGGMGSHHMDEAFGDDFVLPPDRSYCETCAGVGSIMFSWRLLLETGEARYADLIERTLYNIIATSPARDGRSFFYANTLHQRTESSPAAQNDDGVTIRGGSSGRQAWFEVSCCPPNVARTLASIGAYAMTTRGESIQVHQYFPLESRVALPDGDATIRLDTTYPSSGRATVEYLDGPQDSVTLELRVPSWAVGAELRGPHGTRPVEPGTYARASVRRGETVTIAMPMQARVSVPDSRIDALAGTVAIERGPEVLALESVDLPAGWTLDEARFVGLDTSTGPAQMVTLERSLREEAPWPFGSPVEHAVERATVPLVEYHDWAERGRSAMRIWIPMAL